ncbi:MAG: DUF454 domain-containing protein [Chloroflexi bacterium]|nr:DUF454 domain-containing protein [Chloroflexota bacterium]
MGKRLLLVAGIVTTVLGLVGVVVPLLPTTPFLLLAAACYIRSSERLYRWLTTHRLFGAYIRNYREHHAVALHAKVLALVLLWGTIVYGIIRMDLLWPRLVLAVILIGVTWHLLSLKTLTREMLAQSAASAVPDDGDQAPSA